MKYFLSAISLFAILTGGLVIVDRLIPPKRINAKVFRVIKGIENAGKTRRRVQTHSIVVTENYEYFPIYMHRQNQFVSGDSICINVSSIFNKPWSIENYSLGASFFPSLSIFSHFFFISFSMFLTGLIGFSYRENINIHSAFAMTSVALLIALVFVF